MGASSYDYEQIGDPIQQLVVAQNEIMEDSDIAQELVESIANTVGWWPVVGLILCGAIFVFKKRIKRALIAFIREK